nr:importin-5-like [Ipomoea batatas]
MPLLLRSALENELHFPVSVDSPIITLPKIIILALVQALEIAKTWALDNDEIIGSIWKIAPRAICIYVEFDRETFKQHLRVWNSYFSTLTNTWLKKLLFVLKGKSVSSFVVKKLTCTRLSTQNIIIEIVYLKIMWQKDTTPEERRMNFDIFHCIAEEFRKQGLRPYAKYIPFLFEASKDTVPNIQQGLRPYAKHISILFEASKDTVPNIQQIAARAIGIYVEFDRETCKEYLRGMFFQQKDTTPEERRMTFDIFHCIAEEFRKQGLRPYAKYIPFLFEASKDTVPNIQQIAARAIGIYVEFDRETCKEYLRVWNSYFSTLTNTWLKKLLFVLKGKSVSSFVVKKLTCTSHPEGTPEKKLLHRGSSSVADISFKALHLDVQGTPGCAKRQNAINWHNELKL